MLYVSLKIPYVQFIKKKFLNETKNNYENYEIQ